MSSASDAESDCDVKISRHGDCEVCGSSSAIYSCPKCEVKTCCLSCVRIHKNELDCDGIRDRTKFIRVKDFTDADLLSDYRLLEECARFVYGVKNDKKKRFTRVDKDLPLHLYKLKVAARQRGTIVQFLAQNFTRHSVNTTRFNYKTNTISWRVEWVFPNVESAPLKFVDEKCLEAKRISELLNKYIDPNMAPFDGSKALMYYRSVGFSGIKILLKAEKVKGSARKFFELDPAETLAENLSGKCIVEFPIIFIVLKDHAYSFEIISPEDEFDYEESPRIDSETKVDKGNNNVRISDEQANNNKMNVALAESHAATKVRKRPRQLLTQKIAEQKKFEIEKEIKAEKKKRPKNLLFTTGYSSEESESDKEENQL